MRTIQVKEFKDRDGRVWEQVPHLSDRLRHVFPSESAPAPVPGWPLKEIDMERVVIEYLVGPLVEV